VQQRPDRFRFGGAVFHSDSSNAKYVGDVRNPRLFPKLTAMNARGVKQRFSELVGECHAGRL